MAFLAPPGYAYGCIVFAISCFDWVMIILYLLQKLR